jgi:hypothetical protein
LNIVFLSQQQSLSPPHFIYLLTNTTPPLTSNGASSNAMGGIIAVYRKVAPAPPIESKYAFDAITDNDAAATEEMEETFRTSNPFEYLYVLCAGNVDSLGLTTMTIHKQDNLMLTRLTIESMAKRNPKLIQHGRFLFVMPDNTMCQRGYENDVQTMNAGWRHGGTLRLVVRCDQPPVSMRGGENSVQDDEKEQEILADMASTPSSPPSIMARPLLTPSGSNTHTLTGTSEILAALREEESLLRHQDAIKRLNAAEQRGEHSTVLNDQDNEGYDKEKVTSVKNMLLELKMKLMPINCTPEIQWRMTYFHDGTRQWYLDKFDRWVASLGERHCSGSTALTTPIGLLLAPLGASVSP